MDREPQSLEPPVKPRAELVKTIGMLNLVFGGALFLCGLGCLHPIAPILADFKPFTYETEMTQLVYEQYRGQLIGILADQEKKATDARDKARLKQERMAWEANRTKIVDQLDVKAINRDLFWLPYYLWADVVTAPILNLLMLASGLGLVQLKSWARAMGLWVARLKILRLVLLTLFLFVCVVPPTSRILASMLSTDFAKVAIAIKAAKDGTNAGDVPLKAQFTPDDLRPVFRFMGHFYAVGLLAFGAVYPSISLIILTRPGARLACELASEVEPEEEAE
ncbi:hypothetical protein ACYOEI_18205 [Singulisphaera rosea]